jgi:hypothetical protein
MSGSGGGLTGISLSSALGVLEQDLRRVIDESTADEIEIEIGLVAVPDGSDVRWELAQPGSPANHHVRLRMKPNALSRSSSGRSRENPGKTWPVDRSAVDFDHDSTPISETTRILDPDLDLPPIVRPKPGIREDDGD